MPSHHRLGILYLYLSNLVDSGGGDSDDSDDSDGYFFSLSPLINVLQFLLTLRWRLSWLARVHSTQVRVCKANKCDQSDMYI